MSSADLNLSTLELTSTLRTAPLNGQASSTDYNESQREFLVDLTTLTDFINNVILPLINPLTAGALQPTNLPVGIEGRTINSDTSDLSALFYDDLTNTPLTLAESLRLLDGMLTTMEQQLIDMGIQVATLQAQLASTNQNDIALALQNLSSALNQISINLQTQGNQITQIIGTQISAARSVSEVVDAGSTYSVTVNFLNPFADNYYTCNVSVECTDGVSGLVSVGAFQKNGTGQGVIVGLVNNDTVNHNVIVHVMASHD
jgi:hypothetical protein